MTNFQLEFILVKVDISRLIADTFRPTISISVVVGVSKVMISFLLIFYLYRIVLSEHFCSKISTYRAVLYRKWVAFGCNENCLACNPCKLFSAYAI